MGDTEITLGSPKREVNITFEIRGMLGVIKSNFKEGQCNFP